ncbi:tRNA-splicing ligase RtcB [Candidatus Magnetomoraceae bacterium gMMP-15]
MSIEIKKIDDYRWKIPRSGSMRVPGMIYSNESMMNAILNKDQNCLKQVMNVACLPGIVKASMAMPDIHAGYGFPIGGVAAFDWKNGIISPGSVGYDINCGVRLMSTFLEEKDVKPKIENLADALYQAVPSGVGSKSKFRLSQEDEKKVLIQGSKWVVKQGFGENSDVEHTEDEGCMPDADPSVISEKALKRGRKQLGTLGGGNHFLEVGVVDTIFDPAIAQAFGLFKGQVTVLLHTGSRGLGYQICDDYLASMIKCAASMGLDLPDRQLSCAMIQSSEGQDYLRAMACAANYAWANRQMLMNLARDVFQKIFNIGPRDLGANLIYDLCHNIAKKETHLIDGKKRVVCVHRKGATRSFPAKHPVVPIAYRNVGQPILIPGDMGTASYVLVGTEKAMEETFGSTCHGAGRLLSRSAAKKAGKGRAINRELENIGILVRCRGKKTLKEEMPDAYKNISEVVDVVHGAGISKKVAKLRPIAVVKG